MSRIMWVIFGGTEESPVVIRFVTDKSDLDFIHLRNDEWIEEFEINGKEYDREIRSSTDR